MSTRKSESHTTTKVTKGHEGNAVVVTPRDCTQSKRRKDGRSLFTVIQEFLTSLNTPPFRGLPSFRAPSCASWLMVSALLLGGCAAKPVREDVSAPIVASNDFEKLWAVSADVAEELKFDLDRQDRRNGIITTEPMISSQFFEPWRQELSTSYDVAESSLATVRRTLKINIERLPSGTFRATPTVVIERQSLAEKRITNAAAYRGIYGRDRSFGTRERDRGVELPRNYWYEIGRDTQLETYVAKRIEAKVRGE
jgi:hypothetical protein